MCWQFIQVQQKHFRARGELNLRHRPAPGPRLGQYRDDGPNTDDSERCERCHDRIYVDASSNFAMTVHIPVISIAMADSQRKKSQVLPGVSPSTDRL